MLGLLSEYRVADIDVQAGDWLGDDTPRELRLGDEGVLLLGIRRDDSYIRAPEPDTEIKPGDTVVVYGAEDRLRELSGRDASDDRAHEDAAENHDTVLEEQRRFIE